MLLSCRTAGSLVSSLKCLLLDGFTRSPSLMLVSCMSAIEQRRRSGENEKEKSHLSLGVCLEPCNPQLPLLPSTQTHTMTHHCFKVRLGRCVSGTLALWNEASLFLSYDCFLPKYSVCVFIYQSNAWTHCELNILSLIVMTIDVAGSH